jgi:hypothetical protein
VNTNTLAIIGIVLLVGMIVVWMRWQYFSKGGSTKDITSPNTKSGYPYLFDSFHIHCGGGDIVGGKLQTNQVVSLDISTADGVRRVDYNIKDLVIRNKVTHLLNTGQEVWDYLPEKLERITPLTDGDNVQDVIDDHYVERKRLQDELDRLKTENEQLKSSPEVYMNDMVSNVERLAKASKPPMQKRPM